MLRTRIRLAWFIAGILIPGVAESLNPERRIDQHAHSAWTVKEGKLAGYAKAVTQTTDGYLWIGTEFGLIRFDGFRFVEWSFKDNELPDRVITALAAARDGALWIGTTGGLARWRGNQLTVIPELRGHHIGTVSTARDGSTWVGTITVTGHGLLCVIRDDELSCRGDNGMFGRYVIAVHEDNAGAIWAGSAAGLWQINGRSEKLFNIEGTSPEVHSIVDGYQSDVYAAASRSVIRVRDGRRSNLGFGDVTDLKPTVLFKGRDGCLWIGTQNQGLLRVCDGRVDRFAHDNGLSADFVTSLLEDREGNMWVGTLGGLDRFRETAAATIATSPRSVVEPAMAVHSTRDGVVWVTTVSGLHRWADGRMATVSSPDLSGAIGVGSIVEQQNGVLLVSTLSGLVSLDPATRSTRRLPTPDVKYVSSMVAAPDGSIWISDLNRGLFQLRGYTVVRSLDWSQLGGQPARALAPDDAGGLWLGLSNGGLAHLRDGIIDARFDDPSWLRYGPVNAIASTRYGLLVSTQLSLLRIIDGRPAAVEQGTLPCYRFQWAAENGKGDLWLYSECGIMHVRAMDAPKWLDGVAGIEPRLYGIADGVPRRGDLGGYGPKVARDPMGRIWFVSYDGVSMLDPSRLPDESEPPLVHIESATADNISYDVSAPQHLPARRRDLRIDYTGLSLAAPERVRFRYRLLGRDTSWIEAQDRRQAFYTDLPPGSYRFEVIASAGRGRWSPPTAWQFSIAPALAQTAAFQMSIIALIAVGAIAVYRWRVRTVARRLNVIFNERLAERTRIAEDLHDTLLQDVISTSMQLHMIATNVPDQDHRARLNEVTQKIVAIVEAGRDMLTGLRTPAPADIDTALIQDAKAIRGSSPIDIKVAITGQRMALSDPARDAVYRIGREALMNCFKHAAATIVELELEFGAQNFALYVRDNGVGVAEQVLETGPRGHFGVQGMRDRAARVSGTLTIHSAEARGTEVHLTIPAAIAYAERQSNQGVKWRAKQWISKTASRFRPST